MTLEYEGFVIQEIPLYKHAMGKEVLIPWRSYTESPVT